MFLLQRGRATSRSPKALQASWSRLYHGSGGRVWVPLLPLTRSMGSESRLRVPACGWTEDQEAPGDQGPFQRTGFLRFFSSLFNHHGRNDSPLESWHPGNCSSLQVTSYVSSWNYKLWAKDDLPVPVAAKAATDKKSTRAQLPVAVWPEHSPPWCHERWPD